MVQDSVFPGKGWVWGPGFILEARVPPAATACADTPPECRSCTDPLVFRGDDGLLVLFCDQDAGAVGGLEHINDQGVG